MYEIDEALALYAQDHWGTFPDRKVIELHGSRMLISRRVGSGHWLRMAPGALAFPSWPASFERSLWAAVHSGPQRTMVGPFAAAALYKFTGFPRNRLDILVPHGTTHTNSIAIVRQTRNMPAATTVDGFSVPHRERVLCELARNVGPLKLGRAIDDLLVEGKLAMPRLERTFVSLAVPSWPGLRVMGKVIAERGSGYVPTRSELERALRRIIATIDGITVDFERQIGDALELPHRVDCVIEQPAKLIVEADGRAYHQRVEDMASDRRRDRRAAALGYPTFRFLYGEITEHGSDVRDEITGYLASPRPIGVPA